MKGHGLGVFGGLIEGPKWGFPKIRVTYFGVLIIGIPLFSVLY